MQGKFHAPLQHNDTIVYEWMEKILTWKLIGFFIRVPPSLPSPFFPLTLSLWPVPASFACRRGAHGWVAKICQPSNQTVDILF